MKPHTFLSNIQDLVRETEKTAVADAIPQSNQPQRVNLNAFGFKQAGHHGGATEALANVLEWIRQARYVEENYDENERNRDREALEARRDDIKQQKAALLLKIKHIEEEEVPDCLSEIEEKETEIRDLEKRIAEGKLNSEFNPIRFNMYKGLSIILFIYLIFYYASVINSAFFRNAASMLQNASSQNLAMLMSSIFDPTPLFVFSPVLIFIYLGAFLFIGFGLMPHILFKWNERSSGWKAWLSFASVLLLTFLIDALLAYRIDKGLHELRQYMRMQEEWVWYKSEIFWLVLVFGFGAYMVWSLMFEAYLHERAKRRPDVKALLDIKALKHDINAIREKIRELRKQVNDLRQQISALDIQMEQIARQLMSAVINPQQLLRNLENFYHGWLKYLNNLVDEDERRTKIAASEQVFREFKDKHFTTNPITFN